MAGKGSGAHPHLVVDQVKHGVVGDPVQGKAGQPLLQRLQQLPDWRSSREQLHEEGATGELQTQPGPAPTAGTAPPGTSNSICGGAEPRTGPLRTRVSLMGGRKPEGPWGRRPASASPQDSLRPRPCLSPAHACSSPTCAHSLAPSR